MFVDTVDRRSVNVNIVHLRERDNVSYEEHQQINFSVSFVSLTEDFTHPQLQKSRPNRSPSSWQQIHVQLCPVSERQAVHLQQFVNVISARSRGVKVEFCNFDNSYQQIASLQQVG